MLAIGGAAVLGFIALFNQVKILSPDAKPIIHKKEVAPQAQQFDPFYMQ